MGSRSDTALLSIAMCIANTSMATVGVIMIGLLAGLILGLARAPVEFLFYKPPIFTAFIVIGLALGFLVNRLLRSRLAMLSWVLPLIWIVFWTLDDVPLNGFRHALNYYFGSGNGGGLDALASTIPFQSSLAYSLGAWLALKWHRKSAHNP